MGAEVAAIVGLSALGSLIHFKSASDTNAANKTIAREANQLSAEQFAQSMEYNTSERLAAQNYNTKERLAAQQYNTMERHASQSFALDMFNRANEYNSPNAQAARLRAAGINPAVVDGAGSAQSMQSTPASISPASISAASAGGLPKITVPEMQNTLDARLLLESLEKSIEAQDKFQDVLGKKTDNETRNAKNLAEIQKLKSDTYNQLQNANLSIGKRRNLEQEYRNLQVQENILQNENKMGQIQVRHTAELLQGTIQAQQDAHQESLLRQDSMHMANDFAPGLNELQKKEMSANIANAISQCELRVKQGEKLDHEMVIDSLNAQGIRIENRKKFYGLAKERTEYQRATDEGNLRNDRVARLIDNVFYYVRSNTIGAFKLK